MAPRGSILLISNRDRAEWPDLFGEPLLASAALDRLTHGAHFVEMTLTGPTLTAFLALRDGVAGSRNRIDLDRFKRSWNEMLVGRVQIETVKFQPDVRRTAGPLSWHLSSKEIQFLSKKIDATAPAALGTRISPCAPG